MTLQSLQLCCCRRLLTQSLQASLTRRWLTEAGGIPLAEHSHMPDTLHTDAMISKTPPGGGSSTVHLTQETSKVWGDWLLSWCDQALK